MLRGCALLLGALVSGSFVGCGYSSSRAPVGRDSSPRPPITEASPGDVYVVRSGDTLYSIAFRFGRDHRDLARWNGIEIPYVIHPKQQLSLKPITGRKTSLTRSSVPSPVTKKRGAVSPRPAASVKSSRKAPASSFKEHRVNSVAGRKVGRLIWQWPAQGKVIRKYRPSGNRGLDIAGRPGAPVRAAASGRIVYTGSGLIGYGKLVIVKHSERFLTAYAHNRRVLVAEGQPVKHGTLIAEMGSSGTNRVKLHFEIRKDGVPVNPIRYLPRR